MKVCKYCGKDMPDSKKKYCSHDCWLAVEGFDAGLALERKQGKVSLDAFMAAGGDVSDGGVGAETIYNQIDGTSKQPDTDVFNELTRLLADGKLDAIDGQIIQALSEYPKPSNREVGKQLNLSHETINKRIAKLKALLANTNTIKR